MANLVVSIGAPGTYSTGGFFDYRVTYCNLGNASAENVVLTVVLPSSVTLRTSTTDGTYNAAYGTITWNLNTVPAYPAGVGNRGFTVTVPTTITEGTQIVATASISTSSAESSQSDNQASVRTIIQNPPLPDGVSVGPANGISGDTLSVWVVNPIDFTYTNAEATGVDVTISLDDGKPDITGSMTGGPPRWNYTIQLRDREGKATVTYTVHSPNGTSSISFKVYIDPAGYVYDSITTERIEGATAWLQQPDGNGGWKDVAVGQENMQPDKNPLTTNVNGQFQWDTIAGAYRVHVEAPGYEPADSIAVVVPPPVTDLNIALTPLSTPPETMSLLELLQQPIVLLSLALVVIVIVAVVVLFLRKRRKTKKETPS